MLLFGSPFVNMDLVFGIRVMRQYRIRALRPDPNPDQIQIKNMMMWWSDFFYLAIQYKVESHL